MKIFIAGIGIAAALAIPTIFGFVPAVIGASGLLIFIAIFLSVFAVFARGPPMEFISARMRGGVILGIVKRTKEIAFGRFDPTAGMVRTEKHGSFVLMPDRLYSAGGVTFGIAPENVGYNVGVDHAQLVEELEKRGINDIRDVCDLNEFGQFKNFKDDPRIKDLAIEIKPELTSFDDFYRYTTEASNPHQQDANIEIARAQGQLGQEMRKIAWLIGAGILVFLVCIGVFVLLQGRGGEQIIRIVGENAGSVIPA